MKRTTWRKWHKWLGLIFCFFLLMFSVSGIILNHRHMYGKVNVSRKWLPESYQYKNWNNGLMRGTVGDSLPRPLSLKGKGRLRAANTPSHPFPLGRGMGRESLVLLFYGSSGIYLTDSSGRDFKDFNRGMPASADSRNIRSVVQLPDGTLFALAPYDVYRWVHSQWSRIPIGSQSKVDPTRFTDLATRGDTLVVLSRSHVYQSLPPYTSFTKIALKTPADYDGKVSLFRTVWMIHSGEICGIPGKVFMDLMGLLFIFLSITGLIIWLFPKILRNRRKIHPTNSSPWGRLGGASLLYHERLGRWTIILTLFVTLTGWMLRPPVLIALVKTATHPIPFSKLDTDNAWEDKLRMIEWDDAQHDWILSTSQGFYSLRSFNEMPIKLTDTPPVSVMGLNVLQTPQPPKGASVQMDDMWLIGSFAGMFVWNRTTGESFDYFTGEPAPKSAGAPFGNIAVAGYSDDFQCGPIINTYYEGAMTPDCQSVFSQKNCPSPSLPLAGDGSGFMSVWSLALEVHTGRIYTFMCGAETLVYIFFAGIIIAFILWSGWKIKKPSKQHIKVTSK